MTKIQVSASQVRGGDSYCKVGGLMRGEARQRAIARCDLGGCGGMQNFWGVFWVSEINSDALSVVQLVISPGSIILRDVTYGEYEYTPYVLVASIGGGAQLLSVKVGGLSSLPLKVGGPKPPLPPLYLRPCKC